MLSRHEQRALEFRALAAEARAKAAAADLGMMRERHDVSAARWESLADFEDLYIRNAAARRRALEPSVT